MLVEKDGAKRLYFVVETKSSLFAMDLRAKEQELNQMLRDRAEGREPDFEQFMDRWGENFPPGINNLDELIQHLQDRIGQMQSLLHARATFP